jgi:Bacterial dnaA protein helix-turn-helix
MTPLREFQSAAELLAFYRDLRLRMKALRPPPPPPPPVLVVERAAKAARSESRKGRIPASESPAVPEPPAPPPPPPRFILPPSRMKTIMQAAAAEFEMPLESASSASRGKREVVVRHVVAMLARELTGLSFPAIGNALGQRDHTTIMHAINSMRRRIADDPELATKVGRVRRRLLETSRPEEES